MTYNPDFVNFNSMISGLEVIRQQIDDLKQRESELVDAIANNYGKDEGQKTTVSDEYKVTVKTGVNIRLNRDKFFQDVQFKIPESLRPVKVVEKVELDSKGIRYLRSNEPDIYKTMAEALVMTPAKPSVKITPIEG